MTRKLLALLLPLVLVFAACGDDDDDDDTAAGDGGDATEETTTTVDPGGTVEEGTDVEFPAEICESFQAWEQTGDSTELFIIQGYVDEVGRTDMSEAIDFLTSDPETETADQQAAYEGAVDFLRGELSVGGCAFS